MNVKQLLLNHEGNSRELGNINHAQTGQLNPLFHTFADFMNRVAVRQNTDSLVSNSVLSPTVTVYLNILPLYELCRFGFELALVFTDLHMSHSFWDGMSNSHLSCHSAPANLQRDSE